MSLRLSDGQLADAAKSIGVSPLRFFLNITLPAVKYGLASAAIICFILAFTDFGAPKVVGGNYNLLATDIYKQVIGQQNFSMGSVVSVILLVPVIAAFFIDHWARKGQAAQLGGRSKPFAPKPNRLRDNVFSIYCWFIGVLMLCFFSVAGMASLVKFWPYDLSLGLSHYTFSGVGGGGYGALWGSLKMATWSAFFGTAFCFFSAYLVEKSKGLFWLRKPVSLLALLPMALPGMVIGFAYIFFFNSLTLNLGFFKVPNPFNVFYGTMFILVLCNIINFFTVGFFTATTALKQLDKEFETVSYALGVPFWVTFKRVTVPVCSPAILEIFFFFFVNSMTTVSAVIFLYNADLPLASVAIANMDDAGDLAPACAMGVLIMLTNLGMRVFKIALGHYLNKRNGRWLNP
jgi:iron(III) transport system permease protein